MNHTVLTGRITKIKTKEIENEKRVIVTIASNRNYRNENGIYETDFINCTIYWGNIAKSLLEFCKIGDLIGVKGRLQTNKKQLELIVEKLSFLSCKE